MERNDLNPVLSLLDPHFTPLEREKKKQNRPENDLSSPRNFASQFLRGLPASRRGGEGRESELTRRSHVSVEGLKKAGGGEREREREGERVGGGVWRARAVSQPSPVPVHEWIGTEGGDGRSWKWRRTDFPSSRTRDLSPVRSTPPSPPRLNETRWDRRADERTRPHGSLYKEGKEQNLFPRLVLERGDKINLGGIR